MASVRRWAVISATMRAPHRRVAWFVRFLQTAATVAKWEIALLGNASALTAKEATECRWFYSRSSVAPVPRPPNTSKARHVGDGDYQGKSERLLPYNGWRNLYDGIDKPARKAATAMAA